MAESPDMIIRINDDAGNSLEEYRYDPKKFLTAEAIAAEKITGMSWVQIVVGSQTGYVTAIAAVLWLLKKRANPKLKFAEVQFNTGEVEVFDPDEDERYQPVTDPADDLQRAELADQDDAVEDPKD
jgi:hypothetical protein